MEKVIFGDFTIVAQGLLHDFDTREQDKSLSPHYLVLTDISAARRTMREAIIFKYILYIDVSGNYPSKESSKTKA